jgi:hypothetical protein
MIYGHNFKRLSRPGCFAIVRASSDGRLYYMTSTDTRFFMHSVSVFAYDNDHMGFPSCERDVEG